MLVLPLGSFSPGVTSSDRGNMGDEGSICVGTEDDHVVAEGFHRIVMIT